jgi:hypothetical protein
MSHEPHYDVRAVCPVGLTFRPEEPCGEMLFPLQAPFTRRRVVLADLYISLMPLAVRAGEEC